MPPSVQAPKYVPEKSSIFFFGLNWSSFIDAIAYQDQTNVACPEHNLVRYGSQPKREGVSLAIDRAKGRKHNVRNVHSVREKLITSPPEAC